VNPQAMELMRVLSASPREIFFKLRVQNSLPYLFSALKIAASTAVIGAIVGEWIGSTVGIGALIIQGIQPGPLLMTQHPDIFWGVVASMYVGNFFLLILNIPLVGLWVQLLRVPYAVLFPMILLLSLVGTYSANKNPFDLWVMLAFGVIGYVLRKLRYEMTPFVLAFVLSPLLEQSVRQSMVMSADGAMIFLARPVSLTLIVVSLLLVAAPFLKKALRPRSTP
jgi:putative tricarboxylic transport membrane protein